MGCFRKLLVALGLRPPDYPELRTICVNHLPMKKGEALVEEKYPNNRVVTSRYTVFNFIVKNLFEQFCRAANFYFLVIAIVQLVIDTPVSPITSIFPLVIVLGTTSIKQAYEDYLRHRADNRVNNTPVRVVRGGSLRTIKSHEVCVGDVLRIDRNESFPCDLLMLSSSEASGECSVTTANLDGETNLKTLLAVEITRYFQSVSAIQKRFRARISCEQPNCDLHKFKGTLTLRLDTRDEVKTPLSAKNTLLRGAVLRNTDFVFGVAIYTGQETKMQLNSKRGKTKKSVVERRLDRFLLAFMAIMFFLATFCTSMKWIYFSFDASISGAWYLPPEETTAWRVTQDLLGFLVLFNYLIPISLYVTIEFQKFLGSIFLEWDLDFYYVDQETGEKFRAKANTSDLNEELGQVQYLFSDKTGTLTENKMTFRNCSIGAKTLCDMGGQLWLMENDRPIKKRVRLEPDEEFFFTVLALCHTVRVEVPKNFTRRGRDFQERQYTAEEARNYTYQASSPDEKAFVEACRNYGIVFHGTEDGVSIISYKNALHKYLRKTLLFHGHLYYVRLAMMLQYFFYKNVVFVGGQLFYTFFSGFSAQSVYDSGFLTIYNLTMTSLPILLYGLFEQHVNRTRLSEEPELYRKVSQNRLLLWSRLLVWSSLGFWHSACCFFCLAGICLFSGVLYTYSFDIYSFGTVVIECVLVCVTLKLVLFTYSFQVPFIIGILVTVVGFSGLMSLYNCLYVPIFSNNLYFLWVYFDTSQQPLVWLTLLLVAALALFPDILIRAVDDTREMRIIRQRQLTSMRFDVR